MPFAVIQAGEGHGLEGQHRHEPVGVFGRTSCQEVRRDLRHEMCPVGAVWLLLRLQLGKQPRRLCLDFFIRQRCPKMLLPPYLVQKKICQAGVAGIHHKGSVVVIAPGILVFINRDCLGPFFVAVGDTPVPIFMPDSIGKDIHGAFHAESVKDFPCRVFPQPVIMIVLPDGRFNGFLAGNIGLVGGAVLFDFPMFQGMTYRIGIDGRFQKDTPLFGLGFYNGIRPADHRIKDVIHIVGFTLFKFFKYISQRAGRL